MPKRTGDFNAWHLGKLSDPKIAAKYLDKVWTDSRGLFLDAVKDVIQARQVTAVAKQVGLKRESLYRSFSSAVGNPTWETMLGVMGAVGVEFPGVQPIGASSRTVEPPTSAGTKKRRGRRRRTSGANYQQLSLQFSDIAPVASSIGVRIAAVEQNSYASNPLPDVINEVEIYPGFIGQQQQRAAITISSYAF